MVRSCVALPFATVIVRSALPSERWPLIDAPAAPEPVAMRVTLPPSVSVPTPVVTTAPDNAPLSRPSAAMASSNPFRFSVAVAPTVTFDASLILFEPPSVNVPLSNLIVPDPAFKPVPSIVAVPLKNWSALAVVTALKFAAVTASAFPESPIPPEPALRESVPTPVATSTAAEPDVIAPLPLVVSVTLPPAVDSEPFAPLKAIFVFAPVVSCRLVPNVRVIASLIVIPPVFVLPMTSAPAVIRSSSASVRPRTPPASAPPRLIAVPFVFWSRVTMLEPALIVAVESNATLSATSITLPVEVDVIWPLLETLIAREFAPTPCVAVMATLPDPVERMRPLDVTRSPSLESPVPRPVAVIVRLPFTEEISLPESETSTP